MGTTIDKLNHLINIKEGIRQEINRGYGREEISTSDTFNSYIQKLEEHPYYLKGFLDGSLEYIKNSNTTSIGKHAFYFTPGLISVSFPNVTSLAEEAFQYCENLISASFPRLKTIANGYDGWISSTGVFAYCTKLNTIYIGTNSSTVCTLGNAAFKNCTSLTNIYVPASLVDSYKNATNWSNYANKIKAAP